MHQREQRRRFRYDGIQIEREPMGLKLLLGMIFQPLGQAVAWIAWVFLEWTIVIVEWTASLPYAAIKIGKLELACY